MLASTSAQMHVRPHPLVPGKPVYAPAHTPARPQIISFFRAGAEIYAAGEPAGNIYQIEFGAVRVFRLLADGRRQIGAFHLANELFGFEADVTHEFFAEAINATGIRRLRLNAGEDASRELLPLALRSLTTTQKHLLVLGRHSAVERLTAFLADMAERQGRTDHVCLPMSRLDIADYLGLTIETVSRTFTRLKEQQIIRLVDSRNIEILKWSALLDSSE